MPIAENLHPEAFHNVARDFLDQQQIYLSTADLRKLSEILQAFIDIPYENLSKIIKYNLKHQDTASLRLPDEVWEDYRRYRLGGTCFSLTFFLQCILDFAGYVCYPVMGRMKAGENHHCALVVILDEAHYLVDPGYVLDVPLAFRSDTPRVFLTAHSGVEVNPGNQPLHFEVSTYGREQHRWRYTFADLPTPAKEFLQHWLASFHWNGMRNICLTRVHRDSLVYIHQYFMCQHNMAGKQNFNLKRNREQVIFEVFGIAPELVEAAESAILETRSRKQPRVDADRETPSPER